MTTHRRDNRPTLAPLYARVSTTEQTTENQLGALRSYATARGWRVMEFADQGVSGAKEQRPALNNLLRAARARKVDVVACTKLDRLARSTHHLVTLAKEFEALGVDLVVLDQAIDTTTSSACWLVVRTFPQFRFATREKSILRSRIFARL